MNLIHKAMKKNSLKIVFVIDESGSMSGSESDVIGGFNGYVDKVRKDNPGEVVVSLYKFSDSVERVVANKKISAIKKLTEEDYVPGGFTALYDAIGQAVTDADGEVAALTGEGKPDAVLFVIITDGQENASRVFTAAGVQAMNSIRRPTRSSSMGNSFTASPPGEATVQPLGNTIRRRVMPGTVLLHRITAVRDGVPVL